MSLYLQVRTARVHGRGTGAPLFLAELAVLPTNMDVRQWVAYAGLDPRRHTSGTSVDKRERISKAGNKYLRAALYMPALVAVRPEPGIKAFYEHLLANDKKKIQAIVAVMRKLLHASSSAATKRSRTRRRAVSGRCIGLPG